MFRKVLLLAAGIVLCLACAPDAIETTDYQVTTLMLPEGRPEAGREAFVSLGCTACHAVAGESDLPTPASAAPGPELGLDVATLGPGGLATSVIAPSHKIAEKYRSPDGNRSPMREYASIMTVQQLADIVAFLERQGLETQAKSGLAPG